MSLYKKLKIYKIKKLSLVDQKVKPKNTDFTKLDPNLNKMLPKINSNKSSQNRKNTCISLNNINKNNTQRPIDKSLYHKFINNSISINNKSYISNINNNSNIYKDHYITMRRNNNSNFDREQSTTMRRNNNSNIDRDQSITMRMPKSNKYRQQYNIYLKRENNNSFDTSLNISFKKYTNSTINKKARNALNELEKYNYHSFLIRNKESNRVISKSKTQANLSNKILEVKKLLNNSNSKSKDKNKPMITKKKSQKVFNENMSVKEIYNYYISKESKNIVKQEEIETILKKRYKDHRIILNKIYCINDEHLQNLKELKNNKNIAFKDDFNINDYQNALIELVYKRLDRDNLYLLGQNYRDLNESMNRNYSPKGRFTSLANRIKRNVPNHLIKKLREVDKNKLILRARLLDAHFIMKETKDLKKEIKREKKKLKNAFKDFDLFMKKKYESKIQINKI